MFLIPLSLAFCTRYVTGCWFTKENRFGPNCEFRQIVNLVLIHGQL
jgi:hypothetical protein